MFLVVIQPSLRRKANKSLWISKWNMLSHAPFKFSQTCSCQTGNRMPGCHLTCYVGCSGKVTSGPCSEVPTLCATSHAAIESFGGTIQHLIASSELASKGAQANPMEEVERLNPEEAANARLLVTAPTLCRSAPQTGTEPQQTPDSAHAQKTPEQNPESSIPSIPKPSTKQVAFPTDAKEREKARRKDEKERGIETVVKKRKKVMEDHHDDCGDDLSSLQEGERERA